MDIVYVLFVGGDQENDSVPMWVYLVHFVVSVCYVDYLCPLVFCDD